MKIAAVTIEGESGECIVLTQAPFALDCSVGNCFLRGSDDGIYAHCPECKRFACRGHWREETALCLDCDHKRKA
jgi:hypothetical protein